MPEHTVPRTPLCGCQALERMLCARCKVMMASLRACAGGLSELRYVEAAP